jgi:hypothetical protein
MAEEQVKPKRTDEEEQDFLRDVQKKFREYKEAWRKQYELMAEDIAFCSPDNQWPAGVKQARIGKPTFAADRLNAQVKQLTNAQRENRPAVQVHPTSDGASEDVANIMQGIVRHIEYESAADMAYDEANEWQVRAGLGFWRLRTEYIGKSFKQKLVISSVNNPFQCYIDPYFKQLDGSDIQDAFIFEFLSMDDFKRQWPDAKASKMEIGSWLGLGQRLPEWFTAEKTACVAEYYTTEYEKKSLVHLSHTGEVKDKADLDAAEKQYVDAERAIEEKVIHHYKINGVEILEETIWVDDSIPIIPVFGDPLLVDGQRLYAGLIRHSKEEQMMLNVVKTSIIELIAAAPKMPWLLPEGGVGEMKEDWANVNVTNKAYLTYQPFADDGITPLPPPTRNIQEQPIQGMLQVMNSLENDIKSTNSMYDPTMGNKMANDQSGIAIKAIQTAGSIANYHFSDNLTRAMRLSGRKMIHIIPRIMSEKEVTRIIGADRKNSLVTINGTGAPDEQNEKDENGIPKIYDLTAGEYDLAVDSGPSYQTQREQERAVLFELAGKDPQLMAIAGDIMASLLDSPIAQTLSERLQKALPVNLQPPKQDGKADPEAQAQTIQQLQTMVQQLTQHLQMETQLADKVQQGEQTRLKIAQIEAQTELMKHQTQMAHDGAKTLLSAQMEELKLKHETSHQALMGIQKHILGKDMESHKVAIQPPPAFNEPGDQVAPIPPGNS